MNNITHDADGAALEAANRLTTAGYDALSRPAFDGAAYLEQLAADDEASGYAENAAYLRGLLAKIEDVTANRDEWREKCERHRGVMAMPRKDSHGSLREAREAGQ